MTLEEANIQAQKWWGEHGKAMFIPYWSLFEETGGIYTVGLTTLKAELGGHITTKLDTSRRSLRDAFGNAIDMGNSPLPCGACGKCLDCLKMERDD